jgi:methylglutaconyl-CoA hydratase
LPALIKEWIARVLQNSPLALCAAKELISATSRGHLNKAMIEDTAHRIASIRVSLEGQEGLRAFLEKRPPQWQAVPPLRSK